MTKTKYKQTENEIGGLKADHIIFDEYPEIEMISEQSEEIEYSQSRKLPIPKQKLTLKVIAVFPVKNRIVFSYLDKNGVECGMELLIDSDLKFKNLKLGDIIEIEMD